MTYITRNANIALLLLILISAGALVAATVFFQENFDRINTAYSSKLSQLNQVTKDLEEKQAALDTIKSELTLKAAREEEFTSQYTTVKTEKVQLEGEKKQLTQVKQSLENELTSTENQLATVRNQVEVLSGENVRLTADLSTAQTTITSQHNQMDTLSAQKDALIAQKNALETKVACLQATPGGPC
jgi:chromosome segregation ATPase